MNLRIIKKALGLLIVDIAIIIGIFILQFRTDSNIIEKIGNLQLTFVKSEAESQEEAFKNSFSASYQGFNLHSDDQNSALALSSADSSLQPVRFLNYETEDLVTTLHFDNDIDVKFELSDDTPQATLAILADIPQGISEIRIPYNFSYNLKTVKEEPGRIILNDKNLTWDFEGAQEDGHLHFTHGTSVVRYGIYDDTTKRFTLDNLTELASADTAYYNNMLQSFKSSLISSFRAALSDNSFTEQAAVSYVAVQAENGRYQQAIDEIPQSFKRSEARTYLSAPYFNSLVNMNNLLDASLRDTNRQIERSATSGSMDIFTAQNLADYLAIYSDSSVVLRLLQNAVNADISKCNIAQTTGIIRTYDSLYKLKPEYAQVLLPVIDACIEKITDACTFVNNILTISENDTFVSVVQGIEVGVALMRYGYICENQTYVRAGRVIVNSYMEESSSFDLRTLSNLYPTLAYDNWYYPHIELITNEMNGQQTWAWTCAKSISFVKASRNDVTMVIDFPETLIHYVIFKGIPQFDTIYIYEMAFRTDPRFETYNSSGYVYRSASTTLLLKSRHKSQLETVRLLLHSDAVSASAPRPASAATVTTGGSGAAGASSASSAEAGTLAAN